MNESRSRLNSIDSAFTTPQKWGNFRYRPTHCPTFPGSGASLSLKSTGRGADSHLPGKFTGGGRDHWEVLHQEGRGPLTRHLLRCGGTGAALADEYQACWAPIAEAEIQPPDEDSRQKKGLLWSRLGGHSCKPAIPLRRRLAPPPLVLQCQAERRCPQG